MVLRAILLLSTANAIGFHLFDISIQPNAEAFFNKLLSKTTIYYRPSILSNNIE